MATIEIRREEDDYGSASIETDDRVVIRDPKGVVIKGLVGETLTISTTAQGFEVTYKVRRAENSKQVFEFRNGEVVRLDQI